MGNLREGGGFCLRDARTARRLRRKAALACVVFLNIEKWDTITREMDLTMAKLEIGMTELRYELLQTRACCKVPDTDNRARLRREGFIEIICLEKQVVLSPEFYPGCQRFFSP